MYKRSIDLVPGTKHHYYLGGKYENVYILLEPYTEFICMLRFVDKDLNPIEAPSSAVVFDTQTKEYIRILVDRFLISYFGKEQLLIDNEVVISFNETRAMNFYM